MMIIMNSIVNILGWGDLCDHLIGMRIFSLIINKMGIRYSYEL